MSIGFEKYLGLSTGFRRIRYTWRDAALYALAVGAGKEDLLYTYEKNMQALPGFGTVPYWSAVNVEPKLPYPLPASALMAEAIAKDTGAMPARLHMEHELLVYRPIDPISGTFVFEGTITNIYDRGPGRGIVVEEKLPVWDEAGNLLIENIARSLFFTGGGYGGDLPPASSVIIPSRTPDFLVRDHMSEVQNVLYRLTGDTNHAHIDPEAAKNSGFPRPFMQGLCSFGFASRMMIGAVIPGEPTRLHRMAAQMRNICYPGSDLELCAWKSGKKAIVFRLLDKANGKPILDKGIFEFD